MRAGKAGAGVSGRVVLCALLLAAALVVPAADASMLLAPGGFVLLPGSTAAAEPHLAGIVLLDDLHPFQIASSSGTPLCHGRLQNRVVRSTATGRLHFYYRIRDTVSGVAGAPVGIRRVETVFFGGFDPIRVDFRPDGLGTVAPVSAFRSPAPGVIVRFEFSGLGVPCGQESRFFFIATTATAFGPGGKTRLFGGPGLFYAVPSAMPVP